MHDDLVIPSPPAAGPCGPRARVHWCELPPLVPMGVPGTLGGSVRRGLRAAGLGGRVLVGGRDGETA